MKTVILVLTLEVPEDVSVQAAIESVECTYKGQDLLHDCRISGYEQEATQ